MQILIKIFIVCNNLPAQKYHKDTSQLAALVMASKHISNRWSTGEERHWELKSNHIFYGWLRVYKREMSCVRMRHGWVMHAGLVIYDAPSALPPSPCHAHKTTLIMWWSALYKLFVQIDGGVCYSSGLGLSEVKLEVRLYIEIRIEE